MTEWLIWIVLIPITLAGVIGYVVQASVRRMSDPELELPEADPDEFEKELAQTAETDTWARARGFEPVGAYLFEAGAKIVLRAWRMPSQPRYLAQYVAANGQHHDLVTIFEGDRGLTTGSSIDSHLLPQAPGSFVQSFSKKPLDFLLEKHLDAETYLRTSFGLESMREARAFDQIVVESVHRQMEHVRSVPFWAARGPYWYFIRRKWLDNRSIRDLYPAPRRA